MKPAPIICLNTHAEQEILFRALRALGYSYIGRHDDIDNQWESWKRIVDPATRYPAMTVRGGYVSSYSAMDQAYVAGKMGDERFTRVNSIRHFLIYAKAMKESA